MGRSSFYSKEGLNKGAWTVIEDKILRDYIMSHGEGRWRELPNKAGLKRCGKSCRLRWLNYLRPDIKRGNISNDEEDLIVRLHKLLGNRWTLIAGRLPGRTDNEIKNYWNTVLSKKVQGQQTSFCLIQKQPVQFDEREKSKKRKKTTTKIMESQVVQTMVSRCNRVVLPYTTSQTNCNPEVVEHGSNKAPLSESELEGELSRTFYPMEADDSSLNLMTDLDCGLDQFSDLLNADSFDFCNGESAGEGSSEGNSDDQSLPSWDQPFLGPATEEKKLDDWTISQCINPDLDFPSFTSFLGHEVESWLGDF